jgi:hypothetical protein
MIAAIKEWSDRLLGRGAASITVPVFDGALKSNTLVEDATVLAQLSAPADLATDGASVFVADGNKVWQHDGTSTQWAPREAASVNTAISAIACVPDGGLALALGGREVHIVGGAHNGLVFTSAYGRALSCVNALAFGSDGNLLASDGSATQPPGRWKHDLMELGHSGRLITFDLASGQGHEMASGLGYAFGTCAADDGALVCESWRHRVLRVSSNGGVPVSVIDNLPGYPSRITQAAGGGYWLTCFALRTQLVEFVLREPAFRKRMIQEVDPAYWIAPALNSGNTFLEPMQGAHLKMMGVVKPWAPPRSYGLVIRLNDEGLIRYSLHSRFDGKNHGVAAAVECAGQLYLLAHGPKRLLRLSITDAERSFTV